MNTVNLVPSQILNRTFLYRLDNESDKVRKVAFEYVYNRLKNLRDPMIPTDGVVVGVHKMANIIKFSINVKTKKKSTNRVKEVSEEELLNTIVPVTYILDDLITDIKNDILETASV